MIDETKIFSPQCIKNLSDKAIEKRKQATLEIEKTISNLVSKKDNSTIEKIIAYFENDFVMSINPSQRKIGLVGMASITLGLYKEAPSFASQLIPPVIQACHDNDVSVRLSAFEALFNLMKIIRSHSLAFFVEIFEVICKNCCDSDGKVRQFIVHCDRLLKELLIESSDIKVDVVSALRDKMFCDDPHLKQLTISWIATINKLSYIDMTKVLPSVLDGLFYILDDPNSDIRKECEFLFDDLLKVAMKTKTKKDVDSMISNCLLVNLKNSNPSTNYSNQLMSKNSVEIMNNSTSTIATYHPTNEKTGAYLRRYISLVWLRVFIDVNPDIVVLHSGPIISAVLPCLSSCEGENNNVVDNSKIIMKLATGIHFNLLNTVRKYLVSNNKTEKFSQNEILEVAGDLCTNPSVLTRLAALEWIEVIFEGKTSCVNSSLDLVMPIFLRLLSDHNLEVLDSTLEIISSLLKKSSITHEMESCDKTLDEFKKSLDKFLKPDQVNQITIKFISDLYNHFIRNSDILSRADIIITYLCNKIEVDVIYSVFAVVINNDREAFCPKLIKSLNWILLTEPNLKNLRQRINTLQDEKDCLLFVELYKAWSCNPISLLSLCLISQCYHHTCQLVKTFDQIFISSEILIEMDELVRMIESPIFATLRIQLLNEKSSKALQETLYCLLMLLPQSEAFNLLQKRLQCLPKASFSTQDSDNRKTDYSNEKNIDFDKILEHFKSVQEILLKKASNLTKITQYPKEQKIVKKKSILSSKLLQLGIREDFN